MAESTGHLLICGDFNLHVNDPCNIYANRFNEILESCNLKQLVTGATHSNGHTLDLVSPFLANIVYFTSLSTVSENSAQPSTQSWIL